MRIRAQDIDASDTANWNGGAGFEPIGEYGLGQPELAFTGTFDGQGHALTGLHTDRPDATSVGLFGAIGEGGVVRNLGVEGSLIVGGDGVGGLVGANAFGTVEASFWDVETIGMDSSDGGVGLPTELMQTLSTFKHAGWDLEEVWGIVEGETYPCLLCLSAGDSPAATLTFSGPFASVIGCVALVILLAIGWAIYRSFAGGQTDREKGLRPVR